MCVAVTCTHTKLLFSSSCSPRAAKGSSHPSSSSAAELLKPCSKAEELYPDVFEMLYCLGPQIYLDPALLAKVLHYQGGANP